MTVIKALVFGVEGDGYATTLCVIFLLSGLQLFCTGILGQYLSKTYLETKNRPIYIMKETEEIYKNRKKAAEEKSSDSNK